MKRRKSLEHISITQPIHLEKELTRSLLGRYLADGAMVMQQARVLGRSAIATPTAEVRQPAHTKPGDRAQLRGIPVVGVKGGLGGAIKGTRPGDGFAFDRDTDQG